MNVKKDSKEELKRLLDMCKINSRCLTRKEFCENKFDSDVLNRCAKEEGYKNWQCFLYENGFITINTYYDNRELTSKSKEKYRQKLMIKEKLLKDNNLDYYILFPSDLQEDFLLSIFNKQ